MHNSWTHSYQQKRNGQINTVIELLNAFRFEWFLLLPLLILSLGESIGGAFYWPLNFAYTSRCFILRIDTFVPLASVRAITHVERATVYCTSLKITSRMTHFHVIIAHSISHFIFLFFLLISAGMTAYSNSPIPASFACQCTSMA